MTSDSENSQQRLLEKILKIPPKEWTGKVMPGNYINWGTAYSAAKNSCEITLTGKMNVEYESYVDCVNPWGDYHYSCANCPTKSYEKSRTMNYELIVKDSGQQIVLQEVLNVSGSDVHEKVTLDQDYSYLSRKYFLGPPSGPLSRLYNQLEHHFHKAEAKQKTKDLKKMQHERVVAQKKAEQEAEEKRLEQQRQLNATLEHFSNALEE